MYSEIVQALTPNMILDITTIKLNVVLVLAYSFAATATWELRGLGPRFNHEAISLVPFCGSVHIFHHVLVL